MLFMFHCGSTPPSSTVTQHGHYHPTTVRRWWAISFALTLPLVYSKQESALTMKRGFLADMACFAQSDTRSRPINCPKLKTYVPAPSHCGSNGLGWDVSRGQN